MVDAGENVCRPKPSSKRCKIRALECRWRVRELVRRARRRGM